MTFRWPALLVVLVLVPVLAYGYVYLIRRRDRRAAVLASQGFAPTAATLRRRKLRHIPFVLFFAGLTILLVSLARPLGNVAVPVREGTVILAFDVSSSMRATDLAPTRLQAAKAAAKAFVTRQPANIRLGVVAFGDGAVLTQQPTKDKVAVAPAIDRLTPQGATSLAQGMFASLSAIAGKALSIDPTVFEGGLDESDNVDIGYYGDAAIVMLSDGENTSNLSPLDMAQLASLAGVKIYPIGIGTEEGTVVDIDGFKVGTALDADLLKQIATVTNGKYFVANDAASLADVYGSIDLQWRTERRDMELTGIFTAIAAVLLTAGAGLSLLWFGRVV